MQSQPGPSLFQKNQLSSMALSLKLSLDKKKTKADKKDDKDAKGASPESAKGAPKEKKAHRVPKELGNWVVLLVGAGALSMAALSLLGAIRPVDKPVPKPKEAQPLTLPELKLNANHQRQGPVIVVDPNAGGSENPFE